MSQVIWAFGETRTVGRRRGRTRWLAVGLLCLLADSTLAEDRYGYWLEPSESFFQLSEEQARDYRRIKSALRPHEIDGAQFTMVNFTFPESVFAITVDRRENYRVNYRHIPLAAARRRNVKVGTVPEYVAPLDAESATIVLRAAECLLRNTRARGRAEPLRLVLDGASHYLWMRVPFEGTMAGFSRGPSKESPAGRLIQATRDLAEVAWSESEAKEAARRKARRSIRALAKSVGKELACPLQEVSSGSPVDNG